MRVLRVILPSPLSHLPIMEAFKHLEPVTLDLCPLINIAIDSVMYGDPLSREVAIKKYMGSISHNVILSYYEVTGISKVNLINRFEMDVRVLVELLICYLYPHRDIIAHHAGINTMWSDVVVTPFIQQGLVEYLMLKLEVRNGHIH